MKPIYNNLIPFKGFAAVNLFGIVFIRNEVIMTEQMLNHEKIHTPQWKELLFIFFLPWYGVEWLFKAVKYGRKNAYHNLSFEREAYQNDGDLDYLKTRKRYAWIKLI